MALDIDCPDRLVVRLGAGTEQLWEALRDGTLADGVTASDRIRALVSLWSADPSDPAAPEWLGELQAMVRVRGDQLAAEGRKAAAAKRRTADRRRRRDEEGVKAA